MLRLGHCVCPNCGRENHGEGRLGTSAQCECGYWFSQYALDKVRYYWILQICVCFSLAALFLSLATFCAVLPVDPWERFLSPILQVPAFAIFVVSHRVLIRHKRNSAGDGQLLRYFAWGVCLMTVGIMVSLLRVN
ncbi:hypothetical protein [Methylomonas sp. UP202]|uniref:hypothetical protein n=1 Tax=Methylomonas sp. UP202 TaxID=3040943 RepID=UPI002479F3EA|nr:hypothetical protein [Methylomonas sp. UP202]WGS87383.1 hypothetical protein QC632_06415 [Methylomonas sp. UP202]